MSKKLIDKNNIKHKAIKTKLSLGYKFTLSFLIILTLSLFYFVILVSAKPMSFPALTAEVQEVLKTNFGNDVKLDKTFVSFTRYGTIRVVGSNISLFYESTDNNKMEIQKQALILPRIEAEFSIIKMLFLQFQPSKILIIDPKITINLSSLSPENSVNNNLGDLSAITQFLHKMRKGDIIIEKFELQNANLVLINGDLTNQIFIKQAKIRADSRKKDLSIESQGVININKDTNDIKMTVECMFFMDSRLQCDANVNNFAPKSIAGFHHRLSDLDNIFTNLDGNIKLKMNQKKIKNIEFNFTANQGSFNLTQYFSKKIDLRNFKIRGDYDHELAMLNLSQVEGDFISEINDKNGMSNPHFLMSLMVSSQQNHSLKMDFFIRSQNILQVELEKYWPINIDQNDVRKWVIEHVSDGLIKNAFAKLTIISNENNEIELVDINSEVIFSEMNLRYDQYFPDLKNLFGIARFNKNNMEITLSHGEVLQSKIENAVVKIDDFNVPIPFLKISGDLHGPAFDTLKHANYNSVFAKEVEKYLNGQATTKFNISLPLQENFNLEQISLSADSQVSNLKNEYLQGDINIKINKNFNSPDFFSDLDFTNAKIDLKDFDITKNNLTESNLKFIITVNNDQNIIIKDINLNKIEEIKKNNKNIEISGSIKGELDVDIADLKVKSLKLNNQNFGNNNFKLSYSYDDKKNIQKLNVSGQKLYAGGLLESEIFKLNKKSQQSKYFDNLLISINLNRVELLRQKFLRNFNLSMNCKNALCPSLSISGNYEKLQIINLQATKKPKDDFVLINGRITDIGYLCEGLGISNLIADGNASIILKHKNNDKKNSIEGRIEIDDDITVFENETVKKFASDNLYSQIKDSIFSSNKTTFNSVKIDFLLQNQIINIQSLIANNFKIGITSKGEINLSTGAVNLRGMIIPGYIVNSLFGIGKIPLIGSVISGILTGGEGGGLFGLRYEYIKNANNKEGKFTTNKVSAFVPSTIQNLFAD